MKIFRFSFFLLPLFFLFLSCSKGIFPTKTYRVGVDPDWGKEDWEEKQNYVNGFVDDLFLHLAKEENIEFEKFKANWDTLLPDLDKGVYEAILSEMQPQVFTEKKYSFSSPFLPTGPVLVVLIKSKVGSLEDLSKKRIGVIEGDSYISTLQRDTNLVIRSFLGAPELVEALLTKEVEGIVLPRMEALEYVRGLYPDQMKMVKNLTEKGLRVVVLKGENEKLLTLFNKGLKKMKSSGEETKLLKKWDLF